MRGDRVEQRRNVRFHPARTKDGRSAGRNGGFVNDDRIVPVAPFVPQWWTDRVEWKARTMARAVRWVYEGIDAIRGRSPEIDALIDRHGAPAWGRPIPAGERFATLARMIAYQQLAGAAAAAIWGRVEAVVGAPVEPRAIRVTGEAELRGAGLSRAKVAAVHDLADRVLDGRLRLGRLGSLPDTEVIERLTSVRGIGEWSAQMFLIGALRRPDVWPCADVGVRAGWARAHDVSAPSVHQMPKLGEPYRPYRSLVAWYCWQAADTPLPG